MGEREPKSPMAASGEQAALGQLDQDCPVKRPRLSEGAQEESDRQLLCQEHGQPLQTFCSSEKSLLCPGCLEGHQGHPLLSLPEAAQEYKDLLDGLLESLRKEGQKLLEQRQAGEQSWQKCQEQFAAERQEVGLALESLQELLRERQPVWLAWLAEQEEMMEVEWVVALVQISGEASHLQQLMARTERKCRQPDGEFLQNIQGTVYRCQNYVVGDVERVSPRLQGRLRTLLEKSSSVRQVVDKQKGVLQKRLTREHLEQPPATGSLSAGLPIPIQSEGSAKVEREPKSPMAASGEQAALGQLDQDCPVKRPRLSEEAQEESDSQLLCWDHGQPLQTFCSSEKSLLCPSCLGGHQDHRHLSLPEAAQEYKDLLDGLLESLRKEGQKLLEQRQAEEQSRQKCQEQFAAEKQEVGLVLESLQELLWERQPVWLAWLAEQEEKIEAEWGVALAQLSGEASNLQQLMDETERKCCQPDGKFLQDIQDTVDRCQSYVVGHVESISPRLQVRLRTLLERNASVRQVMDNYKASLQTTLTREHLEQPLATGSLSAGLPIPIQSEVPAPENPRSQAPAPRRPRSQVFVTLDRSTAHPQLWWEERSVSWAWRDYYRPYMRERFDEELCVLGCEEFTTGRHWWEVSVKDPGDSDGDDDDDVCGKARWAVGVAKESVCRKGSFQLSPQEGIWAVGKNVKRKIVAFLKHQRQVRFRSPLRRLRVRLDYEAEEVEILDAEDETSLYTFDTGPLKGETLRPFFCLGEKGVTLRCK